MQGVDNFLPDILFYFLSYFCFVFAFEDRLLPGIGLVLVLGDDRSDFQFVMLFLVFAEAAGFNHQLSNACLLEGIYFILFFGVVGN